MGYRWLILAAALTAFPAAAEDVQWEGHTLQIEDGVDMRRVLRVSGPLYQVAGDAEQVASRVQACLASRNGVSLAGDATAEGQVVANSRVDYRAMFSSRSASSRMIFDIGDGRLQISHVELGLSDASSSDTPSDGYVALLYSGGAWDNALTAVLQMEQGVVDCVYR